MVAFKIVFGKDAFKLSVLYLLNMNLLYEVMKLIIIKDKHGCESLLIPMYMISAWCQTEAMAVRSTRTFSAVFLTRSGEEMSM